MGVGWGVFQHLVAYGECLTDFVGKDDPSVGVVGQSAERTEGAEVLFRFGVVIRLTACEMYEVSGHSL